MGSPVEKEEFEIHVRRDISFGKESSLGDLGSLEQNFKGSKSKGSFHLSLVDCHNQLLSGRNIRSIICLASGMQRKW